MHSESKSSEAAFKPQVSIASLAATIGFTGALLAVMRYFGLVGLAMLFPICVGLGSLACFFFYDPRSSGAAGSASRRSDRNPRAASVVERG